MSVIAGKTVFITGATSGIGLSMTKEFASLGCKVIFTYRTREKLHTLIDSLPAGDLLGIRCDFLNPVDVHSLYESVGNYDIDILVNSAGLFPIKNLRNSTMQDYTDCFDVNVKVPFLLSSKVGAQMCERGWGRIINLGSSSAYNGSEDAGIYCASKHALLGLTRSLYKEFKPHNVRVYSVAPGSSQTPMGATDVRQDFSTFITPEEIARMISHIISYDGEGIAEEIRINRMVIK